MVEIFALIVISFLTYAAWRDRAELADEWTAFLRELGL